MSRRICFDRIAFDVPVGFTPSHDQSTQVLMRNHPFASAMLTNCGAFPRHVDVPAIRIGASGPNPAMPSHHVDDLLPGLEVREYFRSEKVVGLKSESYQLMMDFPDYHGMHLFCEFIGVGDNRFPEDLPVWRAFLSSMAKADDQDRLRAAEPSEYEITLKQFPKWGRKNPAWSDLSKSTTFPVGYPDGAPTERDKNLVAAFRNREVEIAEAVARLTSRAFVARELPFLRDLDGVYAELGLNLNRPKDVVERLVLNQLDVLPGDAEHPGQIRILFAVDWHPNGQCYGVKNMDAPDRPVEAAFDFTW